MMKSFSSLVAIAMVALMPTASVEACSCLANQTYEEIVDSHQHVDAQYVFGQIILDEDNNFAGFVEEDMNVTDINADIYYLTYNYQSWKTFCEPSTDGNYEFFRSGGNSASCGVTGLEPGWYVLGSDDAFDMPGFKSIGSCGIVTPWEDFTYEEYQILENLVIPDCDGMMPIINSTLIDTNTTDDTNSTGEE